MVDVDDRTPEMGQAWPDPIVEITNVSALGVSSLVAVAI